MAAKKSPAVGLRSPTTVLVFGALQITFGAVLILLNIISFATISDSILITAGFSGIWGGIFNITGGSLGIHAGKKLRAGETSGHCPLVASLVMSAVSGVSTFGLFCFYCTWLAVGNSLLEVYEPTYTLQSVYPAGINYRYEDDQELLLGHLVVYLLLCIFCCLQVAATRMNLANRPKRTTDGHYLVSSQHQAAHFTDTYFSYAPPNPSRQQYGSHVHFPQGPTSNAAQQTHFAPAPPKQTAAKENKF